jgi:phage tail sheath gpL-like
VVQVSVDGKVPVQSSFASTDSSATIATNLVNQVNGNILLPVTASATSNTVTLTAKVAGARGNWVRAFPQVVAGSGVTLSVHAPTFLTGGAGSDSAGYAAVLASLALTGVNGGNFYYYIPEAGFDSIDGTANGICSQVQVQIDTLAQPVYGQRQRALFGSVDTLASTESVATSVNDARCESIWCKNLDLTPFELAATWCAAITTFETNPLTASGVNFDYFGQDAQTQPFWSVRAPLDGSSPSATDIQSAILSGVTPMKVLRGGNTTVVKRCTSHFQQTVGNTTVLDLRIVDAGKVTVSDHFMNDLIAELALTFNRRVIIPNPPQGSPPPAAGTVSASQVQNLVVGVIQQYGAANLIDPVATQQGLVVQQETNPNTRISISCPLVINNLLHTIVLLVNESDSVV